MRPCGKSGCPKLVQKGYCVDHQRATPKALSDASRPTSTQRGYGARWQRESRAFLEENPLCEGLRLAPGGPVVINTHVGVLVAADEVDHIVAHKGDPVLFWDKSNWQGGCKVCHSVKTATEDGGFGRPRGRGQIFQPRCA